MNNKPVYIYDALRTPRGKGRKADQDKPGGALSEVPPHELVAQLCTAFKQRNPNFVHNLESLSLGCVGQVGAQGGHIGLISKIHSGLPDPVAVQTINNYCVSGLTAANNAVDKASNGKGLLHLAGGVESLSQVPFLADKADYYNDPKLVQSLRWAPPIMGAELIATQNGFTKEDLDDITLLSHQRAAAAWEEGAFNDCVIAIKDVDGNTLLAHDETVRGKISLDQLAAMPPAFAKQGAMGFDDMMLKANPDLSSINHVHSFAHCPPMADGASLVLLGDTLAGERSGLTAKAKVVAHTETAGDPVLQLGAGFTAMEQLLKETGMSVNDFDRIEFMEAFAAVPLKFVRDYQPDMDKVNVNGGHLAMGHPMGATGAILLTQLVHQLQSSGGERGLVVASAGGGIGSAMIIENVA